MPSQFIHAVLIAACIALQALGHPAHLNHVLIEIWHHFHERREELSIFDDK